MMKKIYISPLARFVDLSLEESCCNFPSSVPKINDDDRGAEEDDVLTRKKDMWDNSSMWDN